MSSKEILQQALIDFSGSLILVSHDVDFLKPVVNKVVDIRKGHLKTYEGGIDYYLEKRQEEAGRENLTLAKKNTIAEAVSRKDQKRLEAELRQKKFKATKYLVRDIEALEKEISSLEEKEKDLENMLADVKIYSNPAKAKETTFEYEKVKKDLNFKMAEWSRLSEELQKIEDQFS